MEHDEVGDALDELRDALKRREADKRHAKCPHNAFVGAALTALTGVESFLEADKNGRAVEAQQREEQEAHEEAVARAKAQAEE